MVELLKGTQQMFLTVGAACIIVLAAMTIDLISGLYKAYQRGDVRRSELLKRSGAKFALYQGTLLIAAMVDLLIHFSHLYLFFGWSMVQGVPIVTLVVAIFWCVVEFMSVREKASEKVKSEIARAERLAVALGDKEQLVNIFADAVKKAINESRKEE